MKIKNLLLTGSIISIIFVLIFSFVVYISFNKVAEENERELIAQKVHQSVAELNILLQEYLTYREERMIQQWNLNYENTNEIIEKIESEKVKSNYADLKDLFLQITVNYEKQGSPELEDRFVAQFLIKSQTIISDCSVIAEKSYDNAINAQKNANNVMMVSLVVLFIGLLGISFYITRRITKPIGKLTKGTEIIGKGDLGYEIDIKSKDEIGKLATAFNKMTFDLRKSRQKLEKTNVHLKSLDKLKSMFIASMSHEFRTPLNSIIGFTGLILQGVTGKINPEQSKQLNMVKSSSEHLLSLINDVIDVSKIETEMLELEIKNFNLSEIIQEIKEISKIGAGKKRLTILIQVPTKLMIKGDMRRTKQIIINLLNNAIKFTEKGKIEVKVNKENKNFMISVRDEGIGIKKEDLNKLFKAFSRIDKKSEGVGLGLYLSKKLANLLNGDIYVKSELGKGSTFTLAIPINYKEVKK